MSYSCELCVFFGLFIDENGSSFLKVAVVYQPEIHMTKTRMEKKLNQLQQ